jgi:hypothetical protein
MSGENGREAHGAAFRRRDFNFGGDREPEGILAPKVGDLGVATVAFID